MNIALLDYKKKMMLLIVFLKIFSNCALYCVGHFIMPVNSLH